jgi:hypothetical protein
MRKLTPEGEKLIADIANRHRVSVEAAMTMLEAVSQGGGSQAQFNHYELGGYGQWQRGGMIMIGDMFNNGLKSTVDSLASELSNLIMNEPQQGGGMYAPSYQSQNQSSGSQSQGSGGGWQSQGSGGWSGGGSHGGGYSGGTSAIFEPMSSQSSGDWWPTDLGHPSSVGSQNDMRYAYFPGARRLALYRNGQTEILDTGDHQISGFGQQQGGSDSITLSSQLGTVTLNQLRRVGATPEAAPTPTPAPAPVFTNPEPATFAAPPASTGSTPSDPAAILSLLEKLGDLRDKGFLSEDEFAAKKAELLQRL